MQKRTLLISINVVTFLFILGAALIFTQVLKGQLIENFVDEELDHEMSLAKNIANTLELEMKKPDYSLHHIGSITGNPKFRSGSVQSKT